MQLSYINDQVIPRRLRLVRLEALLLRGCTTRGVLAAAFGVSVPTITRDIKCIEQGWLRTTRSSMRKNRAKRIAQMDAIIYEAYNAFDRSRQDEESCQTVRKTCEACGGNLDSDKTPCKPCGGTGEVIVETVRVRGQAGDPAFLRIAMQAVAEGAKLEGLYDRKHNESRQQQILVANIHGSLPNPNGNENPWASLPAEALLEARAALERIRAALPDPRSTMDVTGRRVDGSSEEATDGSGAAAKD